MTKNYAKVICLLISGLILNTNAPLFAKIDTIVISNFVFTPSNVTIYEGDSVYFKDASAMHPVVSESAAWTTFTINTMVSSGIAVAGDYPFYCQNHGATGGVGMSGNIKVKKINAVFINELHYDNTTPATDFNEGIEVAGPAGTDLGCYQMIFYNGSNSLVYKTTYLSGIIPDDTCGFGTIWFDVAGIQNGAPDGVALYDTCAATVVQFLSYEGIITALDGPAIGLTSTDIVVMESAADSSQSLGLIGSGFVYSDFMWSGPSTYSHNAINPGQSFCALDTTVRLISAYSIVYEDTGAVAITVSLNRASATDTITVDLVYTGGSASSGVDFTYTNQTIKFPPNDNSNKSATVTIINDILEEGYETIILELQNPSGNVLLGVDSVYTITIKSNDLIVPKCSYLFFSEYIEGTSNNKTVEVYNPTFDTIDISTYSFHLLTGGSSSPNSFIFSGMVLPGDVYVIGNSSADSLGILVKSDTLSSFAFYNGDDALAMVNPNGDTIDVIGEWGVDPGTNWTVGVGATSEYTLVRKPEIQQGQPYWPQGANEWLVFAQDDFSNLGSHTMDACVFDCSLLIANAGADDTICAGGATPLMATVSGGFGNYVYNWTPGTGLSDSAIYNPSASPATTTIYQLIVTDLTSACSDTDTVVIVVNSVLINTSLIVIDSSSCGGADGNISGITASGGTAPLTYSWNDPSSQITADATGLTAGDYSLTVTDAMGCFKTSGPYNVSDVGAPVIDSIISINPVCFDSTGTATVYASSAKIPFTYLWNDPMSQTTQTATGLPAATYSVSVWDTSGCKSVQGIIITSPTKVIVTASNDVTICSDGNNIAISATATGGSASYTYTWDNGLGAGQNQNVSQTTATYNVYATDGAGCKSAKDSVVIIVNPTPTAAMSADTTSGIVPLTVNFTDQSTISGGTISWAWDFGDLNSSTSQNAANTYNSGSFKACLTVTSDQGCTATACDSIYVGPVGINETNKQMNVLIYPNPSNSGIFNIIFENSAAGKIAITVQNILGIKVLKEEIYSGTSSHKIDLSGEASGLYFILLRNEKSNVVGRIAVIE